MKIIKKLTKRNLLFSFILFLINPIAHADLISLFPLDKYDQTISHWINPNNKNYDTPLINTDLQQKFFSTFYNHNFGNLSPWSKQFVDVFLNNPRSNNLKTLEKIIINSFDNEKKSGKEIGFGANFRPYEQKWINDIDANIELNQLEHLVYQPNKRAIAIKNLDARVLPTSDPYFYSSRIAGQGYPFDNLQMSTLWRGTAVYILGETRDKAWVMVLTPEYIGWVKSEGIARTDNYFVDQWQKAAKHGLSAISHTKLSLFDKVGNFLHTAYVGEVYPGAPKEKYLSLMIPDKGEEGGAIIKDAQVSYNDAILMPLKLSPHHIASILQQLIDRPYGWGGLYFYNDCSQELKVLFTPFGIWLPRHSSDQVKVGDGIDLSGLNAEKRLTFLKEHGHPFLTIIYTGGHVMLYLGNFENPNDPLHNKIALSYQSVWGMHPAVPPDRRAVIGKSLFFPLLLAYPEDPTLVSPAGGKYFQLAFLDIQPQDLSAHFIRSIKLRTFMPLHAD